MNSTTARSLRQGFPLAVSIAILAFVILISVILMSLRSIFEKRDQDEARRAGFEPVMLPRLLDSEYIISDDGVSGEIVFQPDFGRSVLMAENAFNAGDFIRAEDILRSLLLFFPGSPTVERMLGNLFYSSGRYTDAERFYQSILKRNPSDLVSLNNIAMAQGMLGRFADAIENMKKVQELNPESAIPDLNLAALYSKADDRPLARKHFETARRKLGGSLEGLSFDPCLRELLMESELRDQIAPLPGSEKEKTEVREGHAP
ncbi:MAG: tetratricopeptide repeat protein [Lentisphaeria bacterium]|nr:tetratricopeptide repeat protein [Lentisphaeria bacterium]